MLDARLVGYWSDKHLYLGDMEGTDIAFRADGTGWTYWSNAAGAFEILRFRWQAPGSALVLHVREYVARTWNLDDGTVTHRQRDRTARDEQISLGYQITADQNAIGDPAMVLQFDQHAIRGVSSNRFALERELKTNERDPAYSSEPPPGVT
jgi:hypothetical protein